MSKIILLILPLLITISSCSKRTSYDKRKTGLPDEITSSFEIEKTLITPKLPAQNNRIKYFAKDSNNNPVPRLTITLRIIPDTQPESTCVMNEISTGIYECVVAVSENYRIEINPGSILYENNRNVGSVTVSDSAFCFVDNRASWTNHKESGLGTSLSPYLICSAAQLKSLAETSDSTDLAKEYKLMVDLNLTSFLSNIANQFSIASGATSFSGVFDGNNLSILNYKPKNNNQAFIQKMNAGTVKNLTFSYNAESIDTASTFSPFVSEINTSLNVNLNNIKVTGSLTCNDVILCTVGGVIGSAVATGAGQINVNKIDATINANNVSKSIGGVVASMSSPTASKIILDEINAKLDLNHDGLSLDHVGGVVSSSIGATIRNVKSNLTVNVSNANAKNIAGISANTNSTIIENGLVIGDVNALDVTSSASIATNVSNFSSFVDLVALLNVIGDECVSECGKVIGSVFSLDNTFTRVYTSNQTTFDFNTLNSPRVVVAETSIDLVTSPEYFYDITNLPMSNWDYVSIWTDVLDNFSDLIFVD